MKKLSIILIFLCLSKLLHAQKELITLDEHNKYIYYQIQEQPNVSADSLYVRSLKYLEKFYPKKSFKSLGSASTQVLINDKMMAYTATSMAKHEAGEISYILTVEFKDAKFRYWLTDFIFKPYQKNRYSIYEPVPGVSYTLENMPAKIDKIEMNNYLDQLGKYCKQLGLDFKKYTTTPVKAEPKPKASKVVVPKW